MCLCLSLSVGCIYVCLCLYVFVCTCQHMWRSKENFGSQFSPPTWVPGIRFRSLCSAAGVSTHCSTMHLSSLVLASLIPYRPWQPRISYVAKNTYEILFHFYFSSAGIAIMCYYAWLIQLCKTVSNVAQVVLNLICSQGWPCPFFFLSILFCFSVYSKNEFHYLARLSWSSLRSQGWLQILNNLVSTFWVLRLQGPQV